MKKYDAEDLYLLRLSAKVGEYWDRKERKRFLQYKKIDKWFVGCKTDKDSLFNTYYIFEKGLKVDDGPSTNDYKIAYGSNNIYKLSYYLKNSFPKKLSEQEILDFQHKINESVLKKEQQKESNEKE